MKTEFIIQIELLKYYVKLYAKWKLAKKSQLKYDLLFS